MTPPQNQSDKYEVVHRFSAYVQNGASPQDPRILKKGAILSADMEFDQKSSRESALVVRFHFDDSWFYVDRETFEDCTRKK